MTNHRYTAAEIAAVERVLRERRDMRHLLPDPLPDGLLARIVAAAHRAPSVGYMQPWRFVRVTAGSSPHNPGNAHRASVHGSPP